MAEQARISFPVHTEGVIYGYWWSNSAMSDSEVCREPRYSLPDSKERMGSLTTEQVDFYNVEGYLVLPKLLDEDDLVPIKQALNDKVSEIAAQMISAGKLKNALEHESFQYRLAKMFEGLTDTDFLDFGRSWRDRHPGYFIFMSNPKILDAVESLIGPEIFSNPVYNTRPKVPKVAAGAVPWHQDRSYWPGANANPVITVWIPLVDANEVNGCLQIWPRTHNTELVQHHHETYSGTSYTEVDVEAESLKVFKRSTLCRCRFRLEERFFSTTGAFTCPPRTTLITSVGVLIFAINRQTKTRCRNMAPDSSVEAFNNLSTWQHLKTGSPSALSTPLNTNQNHGKSHPSRVRTNLGVAIPLSNPRMVSGR